MAQNRTILKLIALIFITIGHLYSQPARLILENNGISHTGFYLYNPVFKAKKIYSEFKQISNKYPEELMSSILSATSQEWDNYNISIKDIRVEEKDIRYFETVKQLDVEKNYFELRCKLEFEANKEKFTLIKFYLIRDNVQPMCGVYAMQYINGHWVRTSTTLTTSLAFLLLMFDENKLDLLFQKKEKSSTLVKSVIEKTIEDDSINLLKLIEISNDWHKNKEKLYTDYFFDKSSWINNKL